MKGWVSEKSRTWVESLVPPKHPYDPHAVCGALFVAVKVHFIRHKEGNIKSTIYMYP